MQWHWRAEIYIKRKAPTLFDLSHGHSFAFLFFFFPFPFFLLFKKQYRPWTAPVMGLAKRPTGRPTDRKNKVQQLAPFTLDLLSFCIWSTAAAAAAICYCTHRRCSSCSCSCCSSSSSSSMQTQSELVIVSTSQIPFLLAIARPVPFYFFSLSPLPDTARHEYIINGE